MATYNNYNLSKKKGFYLRSKEPKEGYEKVTYGTEGKVTYHKVEKYVKGTPSFFENKEATIDGRKVDFLELTLKAEGDVINKISVPLSNKGGYTDEAKALISALSGLTLGEPVSITSVFKETKGKGENASKTYENLSIYINYDNIKGDDGKSKSTGYIPFTEIPKPTSKPVAGKTVWDFSDQTEFYFQKLKEIEDRFKNNSSTSTPAATPAPVTSSPTPEASAPEAEEDELPF